VKTPYFLVIITHRKSGDMAIYAWLFKPESAIGSPAKKCTVKTRGKLPLNYP